MTNNTTQPSRSPRDYCAARRSLPFGAYRTPQGCPVTYYHIGRGLTAVGYVGDATLRTLIPQGLIFGIEFIDGQPAICTYWRKDDIHRSKPYTLSTAKRLAAERQLVRAEADISYTDMADRIKAINPGAWIPYAEDFYRDYGLVYDPMTGKIDNPYGLE